MLSPGIDRSCLLLNFSEKISEPVGHGRLKDVLAPFPYFGAPEL